MKWYAMIAAFLLCSCTSNAQRCTSMGFQPGTRDWSFCQLELKKTLGVLGVPIPGAGGVPNMHVLEGGQ